MCSTNSSVSNEMHHPSCRLPTMSVKEAKQILPMGRSAIYSACSNGDLPAVKIGGTWVILRRPLELLLRLGPTCPCCNS